MSGVDAITSHVAEAGSSAVGESTSSSRQPEIPWAFIDCSTDNLVILISHMLNLLIEHNDQVVLTPDALTRFHSRAAPGISVIDYLRRIVKYTNMEKIPLLSLLAYIDLTCAHLPTFTLSTLTVHRFLIAGVCAGSKAQCDVFCTNSHYAKVGGIKVQELNALEREFLRVTQWNLCCNADLLQRYYTSLIRSHGGYTQAAAPEASPFRAFPRSRSKPRSPSGEDEAGLDGEIVPGEEGLAAIDQEEDQEMDQDGTVVSGNGRDEISGGNPGVEGIQSRRKSVDEVLGVQIDASGGEIRARGRRRRNSDRMDVEADDLGTTSSTAALASTPPPGHPRHLRTDGVALSPVISSGRADMPSSPASSSIPASSRSSVGGSSRRSVRPPSLTNIANSGSPAKAIVDRRHAGSRGASTPDVLGGTVVGLPVPQDVARSSQSTHAQTPYNGLYSEPEEVGEGSTASTTGSNAPPQQCTPRQHDVHDATAGHGSTSNSGRLLKNLVGVFRKRSSGAQPVQPPVEPLPSEQRPSQTTPSRPFTYHPPPSHDSHGIANGMHPAVQDPAPATAPGRPPDNSATMSRYDHKQMSPGLPKSVTPRIRTRDERSVESLRDRSGMELGVRME